MESGEASGDPSDRGRFRSIHESFLELERDLGLFEWTVEGVPVWERLRFGIHRDVLEESAVFSQAHPKLRKDATGMVDGVTLWLKNFAVDNPFLASSHDVLIWGHKRRKRMDDGTWWDVIFDPILESVDLDYLLVEDDYKLDHRRPTRTEKVRYLDLITFSSTVYRKLWADRSAYRSDTASRLEAELDARFDIDVDVVSRVYEELTDRHIYLPLYRALLRRIDPSVVLLVVSYGKESFVEACRRESVPVVELQHGTISNYHLGYSFPGGAEKRDFPDYFFTFGSFWGEETKLPIPRGNVFDVGYPFLEREYDRHAGGATSEDEVVFISQGTIGGPLSKLAVALHRSDGDEYDVVYKLHPGEFGRWREAYPWLVDSGVTVVEDERPLYELLAGSTYQVGVYSTAIFEGFRFDQRTVLVDLPGIQYMDELVERTGLPVVSTVEELRAALASEPTTSVDAAQFFAPDPTDRFDEALAEVRRRER